MGSAALLLRISLTLLVGPLADYAAAVPAAEPPALSGVYECQGTGADGRQYQGAVVIEPDGNRFLLQWYISAELTAVGLGIREDNMLAVSFFSADAGGVVLYRIDGQRLIGHWSAPLANGQIFEETLTRMSDVPPSSQPSSPARPRPSRSRPFGASRPVSWGPP